MTRRWNARSALSALAGVAAVTCSAGSAHAGGFGIREQSAEFQGMSFAGNAAGGGGLSGMFWNPAVAGQFNGIRTESHYAFIVPQSEITALPGSTLLANGASSGDIGKSAYVGASYLSYQLSRDLVFGFSFNAPYGLSTEPENRVWAGMNHARTSEIKTFNGQAALAFRVSPNFIVGAGLMIEHMYGRLKSASGIAPTSQNLVVEGDDTDWGWTVGAIWNVHSRTSIGLGYRSKIDHDLTGNVFLAGPVAGFAAGKGGVGAASIHAPITSPDIATLSIRHGLSEKLTALGTVEWTGWSRVQSLNVICTSASNAVNLLGCSGPGALQASLPLNWHDGWFVSGGLEHATMPGLTLRTGVAWEKSPIQAASERTPRAPDADRIWLSLGGTYKLNEMMTFDLAYSHVFIEDAKIDRVQNGIRLLADVESSVDIVTASLKIKLGNAAAYEPLK